MKAFAKRVWARLASDERGASAVEYGLIIALVVLAMIGALSQVAGSTIGMWNGVQENVAEAM
ncbi:MAG: Flp family type IVb pilin [Allosphingosinicella sp.]